MMMKALMHAANGIGRLTLACDYTSYLEDNTDNTYGGTSTILPRRDEDREVAI